MPELNLVESIQSGLRDLLLEDDRVLLFGEDVGKNGGVFRATEGLQEEFGESRVFDTPLSETGIAGIATGMALADLRPIAEIQFMDFVFPAFDQIVSEMAKLRYRSASEFSAPLVLRMPYGGGVGGGIYHSQSTEAYFCHTPGIKVVVPSSPYAAKGLLRAAKEDPDPVLFLEPKRLYRQGKEEVPEESYSLPLGQARVISEGDDCTLVSYGAMMREVLEAAERSRSEGYSPEVIDLQTLSPWDRRTVLASVEKTGRLILVQEAPKSFGVSAEIAATVAEKAIDFLESPVLRIAGLDTPFPFALEESYLPSVDQIFRAIKKAMSF